MLDQRLPVPEKKMNAWGEGGAFPVARRTQGHAGTIDHIKALSRGADSGVHLKTGGCNCGQAAQYYFRSDSFIHYTAEAIMISPELVGLNRGVFLFTHKPPQRCQRDRIEFLCRFNMLFP